MHRASRVLLAAALLTPGASAMADVYLISGKSNLVIDGATFSNTTGNCVQVVNSSNITIRNASFFTCKDAAVRIDKSRRITVENSYMENMTWGVLAVESSAIQVNGNRFRNSRAFGAPGARSGGSFIQFYRVTGAGNRILNNRGINEPDNSDAEDVVAIGYDSAGTTSDPIQVMGNCFKGGGPSPTGGGIMTGDVGSANVLVKGNTLVDPGQYGIAIAGGTNIQLLNNRIYARRQPFTNVGIYVWNQSPGRCSGHTVSGNAVDYTNAAGGKNPAWNGGDCGKITGWSANNWNASLSELNCSL